MKKKVHVRKDPWLRSAGKGYKLEDLGRPAVFLIPSHKLCQIYDGENSMQDILRDFLLENFLAFTTSTVPSVGLWRNSQRRIVYDECRRYEVAFVGPERIPLLVQKLAAIARLINEDCIYFKAGEDACLIWPSDG